MFLHLIVCLNVSWISPFLQAITGLPMRMSFIFDVWGKYKLLLNASYRNTCDRENQTDRESREKRKVVQSQLCRRRPSIQVFPFFPFSSVWPFLTRGHLSKALIVIWGCWFFNVAKRLSKHPTNADRGLALLLRTIRFQEGKLFWVKATMKEEETECTLAKKFGSFLPSTKEKRTERLRGKKTTDGDRTGFVWCLFHSAVSP